MAALTRLLSMVIGWRRPYSQHVGVRSTTKARSDVTLPGGEMNRRRLLRTAARAVPLLAGPFGWSLARTGAAAPRTLSRVRPGDPAWPSEASWDRLSRDVGGRLVKVRSPLAACADAPSSPACAQVFKDLKNPYYLGDEVGLTQSLGWVDAWTSRPSVYAVAARTTDDVVAAVNSPASTICGSS
jgi:hypothetical protein